MEPEKRMKMDGFQKESVFTFLFRTFLGSMLVLGGVSTIFPVSLGGWNGFELCGVVFS